ncbi:hypothetical protein ASD21_08965 [Caulobacter sp. Root1455]|jgi:hypothetical protein|uniref:hypothetical protein n=1 Tax=unclassified Caulobacter TaxID=2648921 RepID=UPI0006F45B43|nr:MULTISPECIES: hypothetical protein [unclassified Caulobacter]KQY31163.1 hypothetical protein ASD38_07425 [Caulobacter sp. Root487D2Y]KQY95459.1 hypothetical protein ASD21_08965 [Caulobacter sp. Root1455]
MRRTVLRLLLLALLTPSMANAGEDGWAAWRAGLARTCPSHHVDWIADGSYDALLGAFNSTLDARTQAQVAAIADYDHRCAQETAGFSCEMGVHLDAFQRAGLLDRFVRFGCRTVRCEEQSLCSRFPT